MNNHEAIITLAITETDANQQPVFFYHLKLNDQVIAANESLSVIDSQAVRDLSHRHLEMFENRYVPQLVADNLKVLGSQLFTLWLGKAWSSIADKLKPGTRRVLVIASAVTEILNLPWELISPVGGGFVGLDAKFTVRRLPTPDKPLIEAEEALPPKPLRVLFMACAPRDEAQLDFEREEGALLRVLAKAGVAFEYCDSGTFDELRQSINEFEPHIVHLTGHGIVKKDGLGYFAFENETGKADLRSSKEMRERLFSGSSVKLAFISGCQTAKAPPIAALGGICQGIVSEEIPLAIGWAASIADTVATDFGIAFYNTLAQGQTVDRALTQARQAILETCEAMGYPAWTLPILYSSSLQAKVFDETSQPVMPQRPNVKQESLPGMSEGYAEHFVGRRRELQRLLPALRDGDIQSLIITGLGGAGKSTLATKIARKLEARGFRLITVPSSREIPLSAARLLQACSDAFLPAHLRDAFNVLNDASVPVDARLRFIVSTLNEQRFLLVLDNFEVNLDEITRGILDTEIAAFYTHLITNLSGASRAIITCRYLPANTKLSRIAKEEALGDFPEAAFLKFLLREPAIEKRYYEGELPKELLRELHRLLGGTPRFLGQMREVLKTMTAAELASELAKVILSDEADAGVLQSKRDEYCEAIFTARLYGHLSEVARRALSRVAVYSIAVTVDGIAAAAGVTFDEARSWLREWQNYALAYQERELGIDDLWSVYGLLRGWLLSPKRLSAADRVAAHQAAGDFLRELVKQNREGEIGLDWIACLTEAREQFLAAGDNEQARATTDRLSGYLVMQGLYKDLALINEELLQYEEHPSPMSWIARSYLDRGEYKLARQWYEQGLKAAGDVILNESAVALHGLATIDLNEGNYPAARENFGKSLAIKQQIGDRAGEAATWHNLATIDLNEGNYPAARENYGKSLAIFQKIGDRAGEAATWHQLASIDVNEGNYPAARENYGKSLAIFQKIGNRAGEAATWHQLATIDLREGNYPAARENFTKSLAITQQIGDRATEAGTWHQLATIDLNEGNYPAARENYGKSLAIFQKIGDRAGEAATWHQLATIDLREGNYPAARENYGKALEMRQQIGDRAGEAATFYQIGYIAFESGQKAQGMRLVALCYLIDQAIGHGDTKSDFRALTQMAAQLNYTQEQIDAMLKEVSEEHQKDRGRGLIQAAFPES